MAYTISEIKTIDRVHFSEDGKKCSLILVDGTETEEFDIYAFGYIECFDTVLLVRLSESWMNGVYRKDDMRVEINYGMSYVSVSGGYDDLYLQGDEADNFIVGLCNYWNTERYMSIEDAVFKYLNLMY